MKTIQDTQPAKPTAAVPRKIAVVPVYNEEETVVQVLDELERLVDQIVVVEDGSTDDSRSLIIGWARHRRSAHAIFFEYNRGLSAAYYAAFKEIAGLVAAGELSPDDLIITVDADGQHDPADLDRLTRRVTDEGYDAAVARRDLSGYDLLKRTGNNLLAWWASFWSGMRFYDVESGYRVFRAGPLIEALNRIPPVERRDRAGTGPTITDEHPRRNNRCARHGGRLVAGLGRPTQAIGHAGAIGQSAARSFASRTRLCCGRYSSNVTLPRVGFDAQLRACMVSERPDIPPRAISTTYLPFGRRERSDVSVRASALPRRRPNIPHLR
ncbi:MAG: glycosyltransferase family 2 protein [Chloroflexi bacterium]|nr:MAG: glycosyltransferase family 2 protein [Chloroflexota bacterium]